MKKRRLISLWSFDCQWCRSVGY